MTTAQIIDACVLINLLATEELETILGAAKKPALICSVVESESIYLRTGDPHNPKEPIDLKAFINDGVLSVCQIESAKEELLYVDFASVLDDGEAMTLAIAIARNLDLATDERKARRLFLEEIADPRRLISTSGLIRHWAEVKKIPSKKLTETVIKIERRASYRPPPDDRNHRWWMNALRRG